MVAPFLAQAVRPPRQVEVVGWAERSETNHGRANLCLPHQDQAKGKTSPRSWATKAELSRAEPRRRFRLLGWRWDGGPLGR